MRFKLMNCGQSGLFVCILLASTVYLLQVSAKGKKNAASKANYGLKSRFKSRSSLVFERSPTTCGSAPKFSYPRSPSDVDSGHDLFAGEFPSYIEFWSEIDEHVCAGALVHQQMVMTSANCARLVDQTGSVSAVAGTGAMRQFGRNSSFIQRRNLKKLCNIKGANMGAYGNKDLAVVELQEEFTLNQFVATACLEKTDSESDRDQRDIEECYFVSRGSSFALHAPGETYPVVVATTNCSPNKKEPKRSLDQAHCAEISNKTRFPLEVCPVARQDSDQWSGYPLYCIERSKQYLVGIGSYILTRKAHPCKLPALVDDKSRTLILDLCFGPHCFTTTPRVSCDLKPVLLQYQPNLTNPLQKSAYSSRKDKSSRFWRRRWRRRWWWWRWWWWWRRRSRWPGRPGWPRWSGWPGWPGRPRWPGRSRWPRR